MHNTVKSIPVFPKDARVCFVGDSLTACSFWVEYVYEYYLEKFPGTQLRVYNSGISSSNIGFLMSSFEENIMVWNPTHVVLMIGVNDMVHIHGTHDERAATFKKDLKWITDTFLERGITVYYAIEPRYKYNVENCTIIHDVTKQLALEYDIGVCDFYTLFTPFIKDHDREVLLPDNVHFSAIGECVIARLFLSSQGFDFDINDTEAMMKRIDLTYYGDRKNIFDRKLRRIWCAEAYILRPIVNQPVEKKLERLFNLIPTRAYGAWRDMEFLPVMDYIELRPNRDIYIQQVEAAIDLMLEEAAKNV